MINFEGILTSALGLIQPAVQVGEQTEADVASQSTAFGRALAALEDLSKFGPVLVSAIDPAAVTLATAVASAVNTIITATQTHAATSGPTVAKE